jgi:hypothetical protein
MTLDELDQIEIDLRKVDRLFPDDYSTAVAFELAAEVRKFLTQTQSESQPKNQAEAAALVQT